MLKISGPVGAAAFATAILLSGAGTGFPIDSARADNCLAAPKTTAPQGQHWYYHIDRASRRKCWYLHTAVQLRHRAIIRHRAAAAAATDNAKVGARTSDCSSACRGPRAAGTSRSGPDSARRIARQRCRRRSARTAYHGACRPDVHALRRHNGSTPTDHA